MSDAGTSPALKLYVWHFKHESGDQALIGPDPTKPDQLFVWPMRVGGWEARERWLRGDPADAGKLVALSVGEHSGWPGAVKRPVGRPRKRPAEAGDPLAPDRRRERMTTLTLCLSPEAYKSLLHAADAKQQLYNVWAVAALRTARWPLHEIMRVHAEERARLDGHVVLRMRVPEAVMIGHQRAAGDAGMLLNVWLSAVVMKAAIVAAADAVMARE
jgi:hypothetical protein